MPLEIVKAEQSVSVIDNVVKRDMSGGFSTVLQNGNFLVTWQDEGLADFSGSCIRARIYSADGRPLTDQFTANSTVTNDQSNPAAATLADGRIVLVWQSEDSGFLGSRQIRCRIFNEDGSPTGDDFLVDTALELLKSNPVVSSRQDGGFSISWQTNSTGADIATRNFDSDGEAMGPVYRVNDEVTDYQFGVSQIVLQSGIIFYTYYSGAVSPESGGRQILGRFATADGLAIGGEFAVASGPARDRNNPEAIDLADGNILVTWDEFPPDALDPLSREIHGQILSPTGEKLGDKFTINSTSTSQQLSCETVALDDGRFAAVFESYDAYGVGGGPVYINLRLFNADGTPCGDDFRVTQTLWYHNDPVLTVLQNGKLLVTFDSGQNPSEFSYARASAVNAIIFDPNSFVGTGRSDYWNAGSLDDTIVGNGGSDDLRGNEGDDVLQGGSGADVLQGGIGDDKLTGNEGADEIYGGEGTDTIYFGSSLSAVTVNLLTGVGTRRDAANDLYFEVENISGSSFNDMLTLSNIDGRIDGLNGHDRLIGGTGSDRLDGGEGNDVLTGNGGADFLAGGAHLDRFVFSAGSSGQSIATADKITDFEKGSVGIGDEIDFGMALSSGGSQSGATSTQASIDNATGVATFASGSGESFRDACHDIARRFTNETDSAGEMALFQIGGTGDYYLFVSDGAAGVTANDVVVRLMGVTSVSAIDLSGGDLTLLA